VIFHDQVIYGDFSKTNKTNQKPLRNNISVQ
jgi:hypothetical protein